ncbi:ATP-binding protein [Zhongshania sp. CAU 1632]|uniref:ATP-binding protein n=1 Tax=Zhongshania aquimaris TaxID=2857107 RepID=A0ABS6VQD8_9GAMM|nr:ATP-binding protein [Zhongshania aquimaris]MBW2940539.1 ATP-binding protein [Zhongshania aquimaris]
MEYRRSNELVSIFEKSLENSSEGILSDSIEALKDLIGDILPNHIEWKSNSFEKLLNSLGDCEHALRRKILIILLRSLSVDGLLPTTRIESRIEVLFVSAVDKYLPDLCKKFKIDSKKQTYENYPLVKSLHGDVVSEFKFWAAIPDTLEGVISNREEILKSLNNRTSKTYLDFYGISNITTAMNKIFHYIDIIVDETSDEFVDPINDLRKFLDSQEAYVDENYNFLTNGVYRPVILLIRRALERAESGAGEKFSCSIEPLRAGKYCAAKRYPLHDVDREIDVRVPMINRGPGIAYDVRIEISIDEDMPIYLSTTHALGKVRPGSFEVVIPILVLSPVDNFTFHFVVSWRRQGSSDFDDEVFECTLQAQKSDVDWDDLGYKEPYSTEVAEGEEFVGRKRKLGEIVKLFLKQRMQSCYISGQKRIGKTSLALAVVDSLQLQGGDKFKCHYIEWGEVAAPGSEESVNLLGRNIGNFLKESLPGDLARDEIVFNGSLSPLNELATKLLKYSPDEKYLVVLDEFDEIHSEMYRYGPLAESFFANIRTLSSKRNLAFILVGGENMPFIINAQGDQLNKFVYESIDYFSKETEQEDYRDLVVSPASDILSWSDAAINELFFFTNGHPYYTKLVCSEIFSEAVSERDSEISEREVLLSIDRLVDRLDTNSFAHHWKDGIQKAEIDAEAVVIKRCRTLVAIARCLRERQALSLENIQNSNNSSLIGGHEIKAYLDEFVRRNILFEAAGIYGFVVPFFEKWICNVGVVKLMVDALGDAVESEAAKREQGLLVSSSEIDSVVARWRPYRGMSITSENVKMWLRQLDDIEEQRLLFKLIKNIRFLTEIEIRQKLKDIHERFKSYFKPYVQKARNEKRSDIVVVYVDGEAKSG